VWLQSFFLRVCECAEPFSANRMTAAALTCGGVRSVPDTARLREASAFAPPFKSRLPSYFHLRRALELTINGKEAGSNSSAWYPNAGVP